VLRDKTIENQAICCFTIERENREIGAVPLVELLLAVNTDSYCRCYGEANRNVNNIWRRTNNLSIIDKLRRGLIVSKKNKINNAPRQIIKQQLKTQKVPCEGISLCELTVKNRE
jgi:hypothetical protein